MAVPTGDAQVKAKLREFGEPVWKPKFDALEFFLDYSTEIIPPCHWKITMFLREIHLQMVGFQVFRGVAGCIFWGPAKALSIYEWEMSFIYHYFEKGEIGVGFQPIFTMFCCFPTNNWGLFKKYRGTCISASPLNPNQQ